MGVGSASLASAALASLAVNAQERTDIEKGEHDHSVSNPGPENKPLLDENPNSNFPPPTDSGNLDPVWYSFDLTHKRVQAGGWTNEVTQKVLPSSKDIAGVRMRLTAGRSGLVPGPSMPGSLAGSTSIFANPRGIFISPLSRSTRSHHLANLASDYRGLYAGRIRSTLESAQPASMTRRRFSKPQIELQDSI